MKKFYEYQKLNEEDKSNISALNVGVGLGGGLLALFGSIKIAKGFFKKTLGFISGAFADGVAGSTLGQAFNMSGVSITEGEFLKKTNTLYKQLRRTYITADGLKRAKDLTSLFKDLGLSGRSKAVKALRRNAVKIVMMHGNDTAIMLKKLNNLKGLDKNFIDNFENIVNNTNKKNVKNIILQSGKGQIGTGGPIKRAINKIGRPTATSAKRMSNIVKATKLGKYVTNTKVWSTVLRGTKFFGKFIPYVGAAFLAWDAYDAVSYLIGNDELYEPEEGWRNAKHSTTINKDAAKTYNIIANGIKASINKIGGSVKEYLNNDLNNNLILSLPKNKFVSEDGNYTDIGLQWTNFAIDLDKQLAISELGEMLNNIMESENYLESEIKDEYEGINISGLSDSDNWDLLKKCAQKYRLESEDNVYGTQLAEETGNWIDYFFIPGFKAMGWATVFTSEDYLASIGVKDKKILKLLYLSYNASNMYGTDLSNFSLDSFRNIIKIIAGDDFYNKHKNVLLSLEFGIRQQDGTIKKEGNINDYIKDMQIVMSNALDSQMKLTGDKKMLLSTPVLSIGVLYGVLLMLNNILLSYVTWYVDFEKELQIAITEEKIVNEITVKGEEYSNEEDLQIEKEIEEETIGKKSIDSENIETEESGETEESNKKPNTLSSLSGFEDYL